MFWIYGTVTESLVFIDKTKEKKQQHFYLKSEKQFNALKKPKTQVEMRRLTQTKLDQPSYY